MRLQRSFARPAGFLVRALPLLAVGALGALAAERLFAAPIPAGQLARDEEFVIRFSGPVSLPRILPGGLTVAPVLGPAVRGTFVSGRPLIDPATNRAVVVRPEALREYYVLVKGLLREAADAAAEKTLAKVERTGNLAPLDEIDAALRTTLGPSAGTRLDDPSVFATYPAQLADGSPLAGYRKLVAGDDALWQAYLLQGDVNAFSQLTQNPEFERFHHHVDPGTGNAEPTSVLRQREYRRVLVRRTKNLVTFLPEVPMRADLADSGLGAGTTYRVTVTPRLRKSARSVSPGRGGVIGFQHGVAEFTTTPDTGDGGEYLGLAGSTTTSASVPPRVINMTPPAGESFIDPTTDWEDPDNQYTIPVMQHRIFTIRLRFAAPLDPRTVSPATFTMRKTATVNGAGGQTPVSVPVAAGVFLRQHRMGIVEVEVTPEVNPDPMAIYEIRVSGSVKALDGTPLGADWVSTTQTR